MVKFLDLKSQYYSIKSEIDKAIQNVIENSAFIGGEHVAQFEDSFSNYVGTDYCIGVGNGTDALEIAIESLNLKNRQQLPIILKSDHESEVLRIFNSLVQLFESIYYLSFIQYKFNKFNK